MVVSIILQIVNDLCVSKEELGQLVVREAFSKGNDECDKRKRKDGVGGGTRKKEQLMGVIEQQQCDIEELAKPYVK